MTKTQKTQKIQLIQENPALFKILGDLKELHQRTELYRQQVAKEFDIDNWTEIYNIVANVEQRLGAVTRRYTE